MYCPILKLSIVILVMAIASLVQAGELWAPVRGYSSVSQEKAYNEFYFYNIEGIYADIDTYEHESQVYNVEFANYDNYSSSNLPNWYYGTPFLDQIDNFTIGSAQASILLSNKRYYTYMALKKGNNSDCRGCCSDHGGIVCNSGVTTCRDGTTLSPTCASKGCNQCLNESVVRIKGQRGHRAPSWCYSTWCIYADATTESMCVLSAPQYQNWIY